MGKAFGYENLQTLSMDYMFLFDASLPETAKHFDTVPFGLGKYNLKPTQKDCFLVKKSLKWVAFLSKSAI